MRKHTGSAKWKRHVAKQAASGLTATEYCAKNGLTVDSFYQYRRRFRQSGSTQDEFVPAVSEGDSVGEFSIRFDSGITLTISEGVNLARLLSVIRLLGSVEG